MKLRGFTLVEILITVVVLAILASIAIVSYTPFQVRSARAATQAEIEQARSKLELYNGLERDYPPNFAGIDYSAPTSVVMTLYNNAPQIRVFNSLTADQNAQLFLNACNANMPITSGSTTYSTSCAFAGINIHVKGQVSSNIVYHGPTVDESEVVLDCGSVCDAAIAKIISEFKAQGGHFPITVPKKQVSLPNTWTNEAYGKATKYCLEGRYTLFNDVVYHVVSGSTNIVEGMCEDDPDLHYIAVAT